MRHKIVVLILALTVVSWAQTATQNTPSTSQQSAAPEKVKPACCDKMAPSDSKDAHAACMRQHKEMASCCAGKDEKSCCDGKDAKSCMKDAKMADCCKGKDGMKCDRKAGKDCGKECCGSNKSEKPA
jgi:hypothetical protein